VEVTVEDQQKINTFSQLNTRKHELEDMLRVKAVSRLCKPGYPLACSMPCDARAHTGDSRSMLAVGVGGLGRGWQRAHAGGRRGGAAQTRCVVALSLGSVWT